MNIKELLTEKNGFDYNIQFAVSETGNTAILISSKPTLINNDIFDGVILQDNITNIEEIPREPGVYSAIVNIKYIQSYELDWDLIVLIKDIKKIEYE